jgi:outer membrane protein OmpA-like peptidoglycan-associated protein
MKLKTLPKAILIFGLAGAVVFGGHYYVTNYAPTHQEASVPMKGSLPSAPAIAVNQEPTGVPAVNAHIPSVVPKASSLVPKTYIGVSRGTNIRMATIPWNATMGLMYAVGGTDTKQGGLMYKAGIEMTVLRQDDYGQMQRDLISFAQAYKSGNSNPSDGVHFVVIMGNGAPNFLAGLNSQLVRLGSDYTAEIIAGIGYSRGEDKCMGTPDMITNGKVDPEKLKGSLIAEVKLDGDQDLCLSLAADNGVFVNVDESVYDPNAMNFLSTSTFVDAGQKYIAGYCENRKVMVGGNVTDETKRVCVNGVATWTPGDEDVVSNRGGLVTLASTLDYYWQMPATIIGIKKWNVENRSTVEKMLTAIYAGGEAVQESDNALMQAAAVSASVYKEKDATYWARYYKGAPIVDLSDEAKKYSPNGLTLNIGGSFANGLADGMFLFGLTPGSNNLMEQVYVARGDVAKALYPDLLPEYPVASTVINTSYVAAIASRATKIAEPVVPSFTATNGPKEVVADKSWNINFQTNKATFTPGALVTLGELLASTQMAGGLKIEVHGHTDKTGNAAYNMKLSGQRALAVKNWLMQQAPAHYPDKRITVVAHGDTLPIASNDTEDGRSMNRRVEIVLVR